LLQHGAVGHVGLGFDAVLVGIFAGANVGQPLVGHHPPSGIAADAQNLRPRPHRAVRSVVQNIALKGAGRLQRKARGLQPSRQPG